MPLGMAAETTPIQQGEQTQWTRHFSGSSRQKSHMRIFLTLIFNHRKKNKPCGTPTGRQVQPVVSMTGTNHLTLKRQTGFTRRMKNAVTHIFHGLSMNVPILQKEIPTNCLICSSQTFQVVAACKIVNLGLLGVQLSHLRSLFTKILKPAVLWANGGLILNTVPHEVLESILMDGLSIIKMRSVVSLVL